MNLTYGEARAEYNKRKSTTTYANQAANGVPRVDGDKDRQIKVLREELQKQQTATSALMEEVRRLREVVANSQQNQQIEELQKELSKYRGNSETNAKVNIATKAKPTTNKNTTQKGKPMLKNEIQPQLKKPKIHFSRTNEESGEESRPASPYQNTSPIRTRSKNKEMDISITPSPQISQSSTSSQSSMLSKKFRRHSTSNYTDMDVEEVSISD